MELLETLRLYEKELHTIEAEEANINSLPESMGFIKIIGLFGLFVLFSSVIGFIQFIFKIKVGVFAFVPLIVVVLMAISFSKKAKRKKAEMRKTNKIIPECQNNMKLIGVVPEIYHTKSAISRFIRYIETMQASTLQECIKLYHEDKRHEEAMSAMNSLHSKLSDIEGELNYIESEVRDTNYRLKTNNH